jgi:predicted RNase H-like HicB family nuclease
MASAPSLSEETATSFRVSLVRTGEAPDTAWLAEFDERPDCSGRGGTPEEAVRRAWAATTHEREPDARPAPQHSGKLLVRMPASLHDELAQAAESEGVSLNQLINGVLAGAVEWRSIDVAADASAPGRWHSGRLTPIVLVANFAVVLVAAIVAITVLVVALRGGG